MGVRAGQATETVRCSGVEKENSSRVQRKGQLVVRLFAIELLWDLSAYFHFAPSPHLQ